MNPALLKFIRHYFAGLLATMWNGGIGSVAAILGIDGAAMIGATQNARILDWHEMSSAFIGACVLHGIFWLKAHPLPETFDSTAPFFPAPKNPGAQPPSLPNQ